MDDQQLLTLNFVLVMFGGLAIFVVFAVVFTFFFHGGGN